MKRPAFRILASAAALIFIGTLQPACPPPTPPLRTVPQVIALTQAAAEAAIDASGLSVGTVTTQSSDTVAEGVVIDQTPAAGARIEEGSAVNIVVSTGPPCVDVPDLVGDAGDTAAATLATVGLVVGTVTEASNETVPDGSIISQNPAAPACVDPGSAVDISVSTGPAPIEISGIDDLQKIGTDSAFPLDGRYELTQDIDASSTARKGGGFTPIGSSAAPFTGVFDGQGFAISGLVINLPGQDEVGLFGHAGSFDIPSLDAEIKNVELIGGSITGHDDVGALCGNLASGSVTNCHSSVTVRGERNIGGLLGTATGTVTDSSCSGNVSSTLVSSNQGDGIGGLIGGSGGFVRRCTASGAVQGLIGVGGLLGGNGGVVEDCTALGNVTSTSAYVGGLIGTNINSNASAFPDGPVVSDCLSNGDVSGGFEVGGLIGRNIDSAPVTRCRATGSVTATLFGGAGGLIGTNRDSDVIQCIAEGAVLISSGSSTAGGLIGINVSFSNAAAAVSQCYALGSVGAADRVGGLIGDATASGPVVECYAAGAVTSASNDSGGLLGIVNPGQTPVSASFWDSETTGRTTSPGGGTPATTAEMMQAATFTNAGWDFENAWGIDEDASYPFLLWQEETP